MCLADIVGSLTGSGKAGMEPLAINEMPECVSHRGRRVRVSRRVRALYELPAEGVRVGSGLLR